MLDLLENLTVKKMRLFKDSAQGYLITDLRANAGHTTPTFNYKTCVPVDQKQAKALLHVAPISAAKLITRNGVQSRDLLRSSDDKRNMGRYSIYVFLCLSIHI